MALQIKYLRVKNSTGQKIRKGFVTHATETYGLQTIHIRDLKNGESTEVIRVDTGPSSRDYWYIGWCGEREDYLALSERHPLHGHETKEDPAEIEIIGMPGDSKIEVIFRTDKGSEHSQNPYYPW